MRRFSPILAVLIIVGLPAASAPAALGGTRRASVAAATPSPAPTPQQIHQAVAGAKKSSGLWATINICGSTGSSRALGIRGQMPGLGFATNLYMTFSVYYRTSTGAMQLVPHTYDTVLAAQGSNRLYQSGVTFHFSPPAMLVGRVIFVWKLQGRQLGQVVRWTTGNHHHADHGSPPGYSTAQCTLS